MTRYVTYGLGSTFDISKIKTDLECEIGKPKKAWWGSPENAKFGWKEWCLKEEFYPSGKASSIEEYFSDDNKIIWTLKDDAKILMINSYDDFEDFTWNKYILIALILTPVTYLMDLKWDFKKILEDGYSAVQLNNPKIGHDFINGDYRIARLMNSWDCESIVVLDPSKIVILDK